MITSNIVRSLENDNWSFRKFYARRAARLLPALFVVLFCTLIAGFFVLSQQDLAALGKSAIASAFSFSNILFWSQSDYFAQGSETKPLLHTWSLGVEEQFYLIWPILLTMLYAGGRKFKNVSPKLLVRLGLSTLAVMSLAACFLFSFKYPEAVFFLTPFRVFQFALGGILGLSISIKPYQWRSGIGIAGITILLGLGWHLQGQHGAHSTVLIAMLLPALATTAIIFSARTSLISVVLANPVMTWIGQRSYAIYLVHWPIMVLWKMSTDYHFNTFEAWASIAVSVLLGTTLHELIEKRFRLSNSSSSLQKKLSYSATGIGLAFCLALGFAFNQYSSTLAPSNPYHTKLITAAKKNDEQYDLGMCFLEKKSLTFATFVENDCILNSSSYTIKKPNILLFGDSVAAQYSHTLRNIANQNDWYFSQITRSSCLPINNFYSDNVCAQHNKKAINYIVAETKFDIIIIGGNYFPSHNITVALGKTLERLETTGAKILMLGPHPQYKMNLPDLLVRYSTNPMNIDDEIYSHFNEALFAYDERYKNDFYGLQPNHFTLSDSSSYFSIADILCPQFKLKDEKICSILIGTTPIVRDKFHLTLPATKLVGKHLEHSLKVMLLSNSPPK